MLNNKERDVDQKISTYNEILLEVQRLKQDQAQADAQKAHGNGDGEVAGCPIPRCAAVISDMTKAAFIAHIQSHTDAEKAPSWTCPLDTSNGNKCNHHLSLKNDGFDLTVHYKHKLSDDEQAAVKHTVSSMGDEFKKLRTKIHAAQPQLTSNVAFIGNRREHLDAATAPGPTLPKKTTITPTAPASPPAYHHHHHRAPSAKKAPQPNPVKPAARGTAAIDIARPLAARNKRPSVSQIGYEDLGIHNSTSFTDDLDTSPTLLREKGRPAKAAIKAAPVASKKRKQAELEEEVIAPMKTPRKASSESLVKKKQKKAEGGDTLEQSLARAGKNVSATPAKTVGRPKAKVEEEEAMAVSARATGTPLKKDTKSPTKK